jgi:DNA-binding CsgD family transcriptional regulator
MTQDTAGRLTLIAGSGLGNSAPGIDELLGSARREVLVMSGRCGPAESVIGAFRRADQENLRRGVPYRVIFPDSARLTGRLSSMALAGAEVRTDAQVPMDALVIDRTTAVLPADRATTGRNPGVAVFRLPSVVGAAVQLFERAWPTAVPLTPSGLPRKTELTVRERELLTLLSSGSTDESAAAQLGISVRTVRRMIADIMNRLGARSRFQAGVKAAGRGWLLDRVERAG